MERIAIYTRTTKTAGEVALRFRLTDGRNVQLFHKSDIKVPVEVFSRLDASTCRPRARAVVAPEIVRSIDREVAAMSSAYAALKRSGRLLTSKNFESAVEEALNPDLSRDPGTLSGRFKKYISDARRDGIICAARERHYKSLSGKLSRFLSINRLESISPADFDADLLADFRQFVFDEYKLVECYPQLYADMPEALIPRERRGDNTTATQMKMLQAFFTELDDRQEIARSPFRSLGKQKRALFSRERYDTPIYLTREEFLQVLATDVPESLAETKDAFVLQCALGCRVGDFQNLTLEKVSVSSDGIPFVHYLPSKTKDSQSDNKEIETPLLPFALEIVKRTGLKFRILNYVFGAYGYNAKIKELLKMASIERKVTCFDEEIQDNEYKPLYETASSKLARKTHVDMLNKVQIDKYAAGLHARNSDAVDHYTSLDLRDHYILMCAAFAQVPEKVDADLNPIR